MAHSDNGGEALVAGGEAGAPGEGEKAKGEEAEAPPLDEVRLGAVVEEVMEPVELGVLLRRLNDENMHVEDALAMVLGGTEAVDALLDVPNAGPAVELALDVLWRTETLLVESSNPHGHFSEVIERHFKLADDNQSGNLSLDEVVDAAHPCLYELLGPVALLIVRSDIVTMLYTTDDDHSGLLSVTEFDDFCRELIVRAGTTYFDLMKLAKYTGCYRLVSAATQVAEASLGWDQKWMDPDVVEQEEQQLTPGASDVDEYQVLAKADQMPQLEKNEGKAFSLTRQTSFYTEKSRQREQSKMERWRQIRAMAALSCRPNSIGGRVGKEEIKRRLVMPLQKATAAVKAANNMAGAPAKTSNDRESSSQTNGTASEPAMRSATGMTTNVGRQRSQTVGAQGASTAIANQGSTKRGSSNVMDSTMSSRLTGTVVEHNPAEAHDDAAAEADELEDPAARRPLTEMDPDAYDCFLGAGQVLRRALQALTRAEFVEHCTQCFRMADIDKSGSLVSPEFENACVSTIRMVANIDFELELVMKLRDEVNTDGDDGLELDEFVDFVRAVISHNAASMMGTMCLLAEFVEPPVQMASSRVGKPPPIPPRQQLINLIKRSTEIRDDVIRDVCLQMTKKLADTMQNVEFKEMIVDNFEAADEGGLAEDAGSLSYPEFAPLVKDILMQWTGTDISDAKLREYFEDFDFDGNRMLDIDEFVDFVGFLFVTITETSVNLAVRGDLDKLREREAARKRAEEETIKQAKLSKKILEMIRQNKLFADVPLIDLRRFSHNVQMETHARDDVLLFEIPPEQYGPNLEQRLLAEKAAQRAKLAKMAKASKPSWKDKQADLQRMGSNDGRSTQINSKDPHLDACVYIVLDGCVRLHRACADSDNPLVANHPGSLAARHIAPLLDRKANYIRKRLCVRITDLRNGSYFGEGSAILGSPEGHVVTVLQDNTCVLKFKRRDLFESFPRQSLDLVVAQARRTAASRRERAVASFDALKEVRLRGKAASSSKQGSMPRQSSRLDNSATYARAARSPARDAPPAYSRAGGERHKYSAHGRLEPRIQSANAYSAYSTYSANASKKSRNSTGRSAPERPRSSMGWMESSDLGIGAGLDSPASLTRLSLTAEASAPNLGSADRREMARPILSRSPSPTHATDILSGSSTDGTLLDFVGEHRDLLPFYKTKGFVADHVKRRARRGSPLASPPLAPLTLHRATDTLAAARDAALRSQREGAHGGVAAALPSFVPSSLRAAHAKGLRAGAPV